jgi:hypothetical protein
MADGYYFGFFELLRVVAEVDESWNPFTNLWRAVRYPFTSTAAFVSAYCVVVARAGLWSYVYVLL